MKESYPAYRAVNPSGRSEFEINGAGGCRVTLVVVPSRWCRPAQIAVIAPAANRMLRESCDR